jgi:2-polyprenyl-3-methyl-5-hydroxy-6-metoxy-1,4-benzoquinol methylase
MSTERPAYTERLARLEGARWKRALNVQAPYAWNVRRICTGRTLDVGCGIGRNLGHLGGRAVGVDHNATSVEVARARGHRAHTAEAFASSDDAAPASYDTLLFAHVLEHLRRDDAVALVRSYLPYLRAGGRVVAICPQEAGYRSDATHVEFLDGRALASLLGDVGCTVVSSRSFPFPRFVGRVFPYNELVVVAVLAVLDGR